MVTNPFLKSTNIINITDKYLMVDEYVVNPWNPQHLPQSIAYPCVISTAASHHKSYSLEHIARHISSQTWFLTDIIVTHQSYTMLSSPWELCHTTR